MAYSTISKPSLYFNPKLYTGNGGTQSITGVGHQPDWTWIKQRDNGAYSHMAFDAVRGVGKSIIPDTTAAEGNQTNGITAFGTDGFSIGDFSAGNYSGRNYVAWNWKAGTGQGSSNTDGSINTTYTSVNTTAGFSISKWTGTGSNGSVGHGLGGVDCMIIKNTNSSRDWYFWNKTMAYNTRLEMNNTEAFTTGTDNMTALPDSTKINMATSTQNNGSGQIYVGYFFQEKKGYSKMGSYTGNGNANGTFVYTGFKPAFIIIKRTDTTSNWTMFDNKRDGFNCDQAQLKPNTNDTEDAGSASTFLDILSNGFKCRNTASDKNASGGTFIYMAFAEEPLVANVGASIPATAR